MRTGRVLLASALVAVVTADPSRAATCPLVTDARNDATPVWYSTTTPADEAAGARATDILSADAWTDATRLHVVVRVADLPSATATSAPGYQWAVELRAEGGLIDLHTLENYGGWEVRASWVSIAGDDDTGAGAGQALKGAAGIHDDSANEVRMSVPLSAIAQHTKVGRGVRWMPRAWTFLEVGTPAERAPGGYAAVSQGGAGNPADSAQGTRPMRVGFPQCAGRPS
jgi:hypothetical protein